MTLTVRSATVTGATTANRALTHAEMDANWAHVIDSANQTFTPSGTGGRTRNLQDRGNDVVLLTDYCVCDGTTDDSTGLTTAITAVSAGGTIVCPPGKVCLIAADTFSISKVVHFVSFGTGKRSGATSYPAFTFKASSGGAYLFKFNDLTTVEADVLQSWTLNGIAFNGGNFTFTDAVMVLEGISGPQLIDSSISSATGQAIRMREVWEPYFHRFGVFLVDASGGSGVIVVDDKYNSNSNLNVNNVRFHMGHMEANQGPYFFVHQTANLDILDVLGTKFEWGLASVPASGPWSLFELREAFRVQIHGCTFLNFNAGNKYDNLFEIGYTGTSASFDIYDNDLWNCADSSTHNLATLGSARGEFHDNRSIGSSNEVGTLSNSSNRMIKYEPPVNMDTGNTSYGGVGKVRPTRMSSRASEAGFGFISIHDLGLAQTSAGFVADTSCKNIQQSAFQSPSTGGADIARIPLYLFTAYPEPIRVGVRAKSASGAGTIAFKVGTSTLADQTVSSSYALYWFDLTSAQVQTLGDNANDQFRLVTGSANAEAVYVDGICFAGKTLATPDTAAHIADKTATINTQGKEQGAFVYDITNKRLMVADGSSVTSVWTSADGGTTVTPA